MKTKIYLILTLSLMTANALAKPIEGSDASDLVNILELLHVKNAPTMRFDLTVTNIVCTAGDLVSCEIEGTFDDIEETKKTFQNEKARKFFDLLTKNGVPTQSVNGKLGLSAVSLNCSAQDQCLLFVVVSGCQLKDYEESLENSIVINTTPARKFSPKCLKVAKGTAVTIVGSSRHPVQGMDPIEKVSNPFLNTEGSGVTTTITKTLTEPGFYGYFCTNHGDKDGSGMAGALLVF